MTAPTSAFAGDDERSLLMRLEQLLEREHERIVASDAMGLAAIADERERLSGRLAALARARQAAAASDDTVDAELLSLYRRLRQRHEVQARIVRRHVERNTRAIGVLAQAAGRTDLYNADGRVAMRYAPT